MLGWEMLIYESIVKVVCQWNYQNLGFTWGVEKELANRLKPDLKAMPSPAVLPLKSKASFFFKKKKKRASYFGLKEEDGWRKTGAWEDGSTALPEVIGLAKERTKMPREASSKNRKCKERRDHTLSSFHPGV